MPLWKQALMTGAVVVAAFVLWALFVPAARPLLTGLGMLEPMQRIGLISAPGPEDEAGGAASGLAPKVVAVAPELREMTDVVTAIGTARGVRSAVLAAEVPGRLVVLNVASGDHVEQGAVLAELDSEAARIALDRADLLLRDARTDFDRLTQLRQSGSGTELQVQEAELALRSAELERRQAEFDLRRHAITAPISGWVGLIEAEIGDLVTSGTEITRIEDRSSLLVEFRVPERVVSRLAAGDAVFAAPLADPGARLDGRITALDNRVDQTSRSLRVQAAIENAGDRLRAGMAIWIELAFTGEAHPAVDPLAIQWSAEGAFVWVVRAGKALRLDIRILQRSAEAVLIDAALEPGDLVVTEGVQVLRPGAPVTVVPGPET
ncbi:efflux RND transporter periplasmic adaptor subunit [Frigidibacter mobilis]|uniref:RND family efflux transporter MFP subunit n=1 Tax=Frigidibacter mobilis TaxID=1335048 RepID=A0A159Z2Q0_9RHOB|nr:efflux RND transporter periplasmic adaptor subunit [Frigidibacter mobilis]AMY69322.1 RND family efflux transporter MFP subunit [Frigidibacter mobilis]